MSDHDPDPIDKVYAQAETILSDDEARAARRARVLAAVAETTSQPGARPPARNPAWRRGGGWLVAASVAGVSLFLATRIDPPAKFQPPSTPPVATDEATPAAARAVSAPPRPAVAAPASATSQPPATAAPRAQRATAELTAPAREPPASPLAGVSEVVVTGSRIRSQNLDAPQPAQLPPPVVARRAERFAPPPPPPPPPPAPAAAPKPAAQASSPGLEELVVTSQRRKAADREVRDRALEAQVARLHAAAAAGQTTELARLLGQGVPIDALDDEGDTALMKSIRARHPDTAAFLRRRGADLDRRNQAGESARDLAADIDDAKLNRALGLDR